MRLAGLIDTLKALLVVVPITALIWLLAEGESLRVEKIRLEIAFAAGPDSNRTIRLQPGQEFPGAATVTIEGPNARVDALVAKLRGALRLEPGMSGVPLDPGAASVDLQVALSGHPTIRESRVSVTDVEPAIVQVQIDTLVTREAKVRVELPVGAGVEGSLDVTPASVRVRLPETQVKLLETYGTGQGGELEVVARLSSEQLANLPEGRRAVINSVSIDLPSALRQLDSVRVTPAQVSVNLTPRGRTSSVTLASVPVHIRLAATELDRWSIELPPEARAMSDVRLTGPIELIEQVRAGAGAPAASGPTGPRLIAYVPLSFEELERAVAAAPAGQPGVVEKEPVLSDLPGGLKLETAGPATTPRLVRVLVKRREPAPAK